MMAEQGVEMRGTDKNGGIEVTGAGERKMSWSRLRRVDSLSLEAGRISTHHSHGSNVSWWTTLSLAFQSIGVIYGDVGTSPLYVYSSTFTNGITHPNDILEVLSLIIYTLALIPMLKYVFIVLWANDNGDGGTFALYSLLCRHTKVSLVPNQQPEDRELSNYRLEEIPSKQSKLAYKIKEQLENSNTAQVLLFLITIMGTSMVIGDGILTPSISVLSAVGGIHSLGTDAVMWISVVILIALFSVQRFGTDKVGFSFAPIVFVWFLFISGIGLYNLIKYDIGVLRAFNPAYIVDYFKRNGVQGWISLGGVFLCITGTEAMFADLGHFNVQAVQISFSCITFPALIIAYSGQAAYLSKFPENVGNTFYASIPGPIYWPTFVVALGAAIIASQAMISGAFAILSQSQSLGCFPRILIKHTSIKYEGQVYIPEANYALMIGCVIITLAFKTTEKLGNAYGIAVVFVMVITTTMLTLIMLVVWKTRIWWVALFAVVFGTIEGVYLSANLYKFVQGGYFPLAIALVLMIIMAIWHYVHKERYKFELRNKISSDVINTLVTNPNINRVPGVGLLYSELVQGIPPIFSHFISNMPSIHSVLVFISIKSLPISKVAQEERFLFRRVEPRDAHIFRCIVRYGYRDVIAEPRQFEHQVMEQLKEFIYQEQLMPEGVATDLLVQDGQARGSTGQIDESLGQRNPARVSSASDSIESFDVVKSANISIPIQEVEESRLVEREMENGVVYLLGEAEVVAQPNSCFLKKVVVNYAYDFLRKNFRQGEKALSVPHTRVLRVGMTYEI